MRIPIVLASRNGSTRRLYPPRLGRHRALEPQPGFLGAECKIGTTLETERAPFRKAGWWLARREMMFKEERVDDRI